MFEIIKPKTHAEWLAARSEGIGSSEVSTILGVNPFDTPYKLWARKKGILPPVEENNIMFLGHCLEDAVRMVWEKETGRSVIKSSVGDWLMVDKDRPYLRVSPDRTFWLDNRLHNKNNKGILEIKTTRLDVDPDNIPRHWFVQLQYQLGVAGYEMGSLAWLRFGTDFGTIDVQADPDVYAWIVEEIEEFWTRYIVGDEIPDAATAEDVLLRYPTHEDGKSVEATAAICNAIRELKNTNAQINALTALKKSQEETIKTFIADAESLTDLGQVVATWKTSKPSRKFDEKRFKTENPETWEKYTEEKAGSRRFVIK